MDFFKGRLMQAKPKAAIGVDIGSHSVKIIKLLQDKDKTELLSYNLDSNQLDTAQLLKKGIDIKDAKKFLNISISGPSTIIRYVIFPKMNSDELKQALKFEAQKHIPFSVNEVYLDGYILKQDSADNKMLVLLAAVKKDFLDQRLRLFKEAGLLIKNVDIDSLALMNAFLFNYADDELVKNKTVALLNIGGVESNLSILEDGIPKLSRDIHIGGNNFTQKLMDIFEIDFKAAEQLKINPQPDNAEKINAAVEAVLVSLAKELRVSFDYYESQSVSSVSKIFLSGGGSFTTGFRDALSNLLGANVEFWDPFKKITLAGGIDSKKIKDLSAQLAVPVGLALRF